MSEMVERVAKAMIEEMEAFDASSDHDTLDSRHLARVMIKAMREPTMQMGEAARVYGEITGETARICWVEMIDEALK